MFCVYTLRQHPLYTLASLVAYTLLQPLRIPKGARPIQSGNLQLGLNEAK